MALPACRSVGMTWCSSGRRRIENSAGFKPEAPAKGCLPFAGASGLKSMLYPALNDFRDRRSSLHADELLIEPAVEVRQPFRIQPELVQDGGVQASDVERLFHGR